MSASLIQTAADLTMWLQRALRPLDDAGASVRPPRGDYDLNPQARPAPRALTPAAVLVGVIDRTQGPSLLLTQRAANLAKHAGQVSFPGGRIDAGDAGPVGAALRETEEETGLAPGFVTPIGLLDPYETGTGYAIEPVVATIREGFAFQRHAPEVDEIFEAPLAFLLDRANHQRHKAEYHGVTRHYYAMPFEGRYIWGATAGMIVNLCDRLERASGVKL